MLRHLLTRPAARRAAAPAVAVLVAALAAGCTSTGGSGDPTTDLAAVKVDSGKLAMTVPSPFTAQRTEKRVLRNGEGAVVLPDQRVTIDYVGVNGTDGQVFDDSSRHTEKSSFLLSEGSVIKGMITGLAGQTVGSRVLLAIPPADGYGAGGNQAAGIGPGDTILFLVDIKAAAKVLARAEGKKVTPDRKGLPTVTLAKDGKPSIKVPGGKPPTKLVVEPLIKGSGTKVGENDTVRVHYLGVIWKTGKQFDSTWDKKEPVSLPLGRGQVIHGWDEGLAGQRVGSQLLLVVPPDEGFGVAGRPKVGIKGTDTLIFVVDVLETLPG